MSDLRGYQMALDEVRDRLAAAKAENASLREEKVRLADVLAKLASAVRGSSNVKHIDGYLLSTLYEADAEIIKARTTLSSME